MIDLKNLTIKKAHKHLVNKDFTARELSLAYLKNAERENPKINAYAEIFDSDDTVSQAGTADAYIAREGDHAHALAGIPFAIKDNILIKGKTASCASKILENHKAAYDATAIVKLRNEHPVFLGRANMDEFAMGSSTERSLYGPTKNPHDLSRSAGGSSGGPAAAVAMHGALAALGSDTGGSVRQPASFCGLVGLKPTYGAVSRYGLVAMASSFDQIGPITKTVEDAEIVFNAIKGRDPLDSTSVDFSNSKFKTLDSKLKIGVPDFLFSKETALEKDVLENFENAIKELERAGFGVERLNTSLAKHALPVYYVIMPAEVSSNLARFDGVRYGFYKEGATVMEDYKNTRGEGFGVEVQRRILLGTYVLSSGYYDAYYQKAVKVQQMIRADYSAIFNKVDVLMTTTTSTSACNLGEKLSDPVTMYLSDIFTVVANITGFPAISIPSGVVNRESKALPLGVQFMAPHGGEDILFSIGKQLEAIQKTHTIS